jgi:hypothetical protein
VHLTSWAVIAGCGVLIVWAAVFAVRSRAVILRQLVAAGVVELAIVVQMVVAGVLIAGGHAPADPFTFWGYLVTALFMLPLAGFWAFADRTRWSSVVLIVAAFTLAVMQVRVMQLWSA